MQSEYFYLQDKKAPFAFTMAPNNVIFGFSSKELSSNTKIIYLALIRRIGLANKYGWVDSRTGRIFVRYPSEKMEKDLGFSRGTIDGALKNWLN